jgi:hypothetical protein
MSSALSTSSSSPSALALNDFSNSLNGTPELQVRHEMKSTCDDLIKMVESKQFTNYSDTVRKFIITVARMQVPKPWLQEFLKLTSDTGVQTRSGATASEQLPIETRCVNTAKWLFEKTTNRKLNFSSDEFVKELNEFANTTNDIDRIVKRCKYLQRKYNYSTPHVIRILIEIFDFKEDDMELIFNNTSFVELLSHFNQFQILEGFAEFIDSDKPKWIKHARLIIRKLWIKDIVNSIEDIENWIEISQYAIVAAIAIKFCESMNAAEEKERDPAEEAEKAWNKMSEIPMGNTEECPKYQIPRNPTGDVGTISKNRGCYNADYDGHSSYYEA